VRCYGPDPAGGANIAPPELLTGFCEEEREGKGNGRERKSEGGKKGRGKGSEMEKEGTGREGDIGKRGRRKGNGKERGKREGRNFVQLCFFP